ncbi:50S ribosomal protein L24 [Candidatus Peregrinibacteria bacterium]|nr:50S ribosomal protein L24 [Candidatus Peregrinibacteria bacterium]
MRVKVGDTVMVITGKDKGKKGKIIRVFPKADRVVVEKMNIVTKHVKKNRDKAGERIEKEAPIHVSNVMVMCPETKKPTRVRYEIPKKGRKFRVAVRSGANLEKPFVKS